MHSMCVFFVNRVISKPKIIVATHFCSTKLRIQSAQVAPAAYHNDILRYVAESISCIVQCAPHCVMCCILRAFSFDIQTAFTSFSFVELLHWPDTFDLH